MSVARNVWRPADISHIVPATVIDSETAQRLIASCPAGLFSLTAEGRLLCDEKTLQQWRYPASGFGITYRFG